MPTQSFLSTDFFLLSSEEETRKVMLSLPSHHSHITLLRENSIIHSTRFLYEQGEKQLQYYIDVSVLPLNDQHVLVRLHGAYTNGKRFHSDPDLSLALKTFEHALCSLIRKDDPIADKSEQLAPIEKKTNFFYSLFFSRFARSI